MEEFLIENIKFVIAIVVGVLWVIGKISENKKAREQQEEEPWPPEDYEEKRENHEREEWEWTPPADGRHSGPPPLAAPPPLPQFIPASESELARQQAMQERIRQIRRAKGAAPAPGKVPTVARAARKAKPAIAPASSILSIRSRLRNPIELRRAIIMREILDPPVGLK